MADFINIFDLIEDGSSNSTVSEADVLRFWNSNVPETESGFLDEEARSVFSSSFLYYSGNAYSNQQLALEPGGWTVKVSNNVLKTSLVAASLAGILYLSEFDSIPGYVLPAVLPLLIDIEKIKLKKSEEYILAELRLNPEIENREMTAEAIYGMLDESLKSQIALPDFIDFLDKLHISGDATVIRENLYKINQNSTLKITFL
jgi:hypothetical protein